MLDPEIGEVGDANVGQALTAVSSQMELQQASKLMNKQDLTPDTANFVPTVSIGAGDAGFSKALNDNLQKSEPNVKACEDWTTSELFLAGD